MGVGIRGGGGYWRWGWVRDTLVQDVMKRCHNGMFVGDGCGCDKKMS